MKVHLVDGTYELFRAFYGGPSATAQTGQEVGATRTLIRSLASMLRDPEVTHIGCAFDHVIESFRNELFEGYKTGEGIDPLLFAQFELAERATRALGIVTWPMVQFEADDALATVASRCAAFSRVEQVVLCSPDKDLAQCVSGRRVVCLDRMRNAVLDEAGVERKFGVRPVSIPDFLALVGDSADGIPGIARWGKKSTARVLSHYAHLEAIPDDAAEWAVDVRGARALADNLAAHRREAELYKRLATLRLDVPIEQSPDELEWRGAVEADLSALCAEIGEPDLRRRVPGLQ